MKPSSASSAIDTSVLIAAFLDSDRYHQEGKGTGQGQAIFVDTTTNRI